MLFFDEWKYKAWHLDLGPSAEQLCEIHQGISISPALYFTPCYSQRFIDTYGNSCVEPSTWRALTRHKVEYKKHCVHLTGDLFAIEHQIGYIQYAKACHHKGTNPRVPPSEQFLSSRKDLDAAWVQLLLLKFDAITDAKKGNYLGKAMGLLSNWEEIKDVRVVGIAMRRAFTRGVAQVRIS